MLKDLADFPQLIETLINSLVGFLYRTLGTFWLVVRSPLYGSLRAYVSKSSLQPLTALFVSSSLLSFTSILLPDEVFGVIHNRGADILSWLIYAFALLISTDTTISLAVWLGWRPGRRRERARAMLRYAASVAIAGVFFTALEWRWQTHTIFRAAPVGYKFPVNPWWINPSLELLEGLPLIGTAVTLAGISIAKRKKTSKELRKQLPKRRPRPLRAAVFLPLTFLAILMHLPVQTLSAFDIPRSLSEMKRQDDAPKMPSGPGSNASPDIELSPVACADVGDRVGTFSAGISNSTPRPLLIDISNLKIHILEKDTSLLDPKAAVLPVEIPGPMVIALAPSSATVLTGRFRLPAHGAALNFKGCFFDQLRAN
jgi:hypothetical protein